MGISDFRLKVIFSLLVICGINQPILGTPELNIKPSKNSVRGKTQRAVFVHSGASNSKIKLFKKQVKETKPEFSSGTITMSVSPHPPGSYNENFRLQLTGFSVSAQPNIYKAYGTSGFQQIKWNTSLTALENLYHKTAHFPDLPSGGRSDCAHTKDPRLWDSRCSTDAIGYFWKRVGCPGGGGVACQENDRWNASPGRFNITAFPSPSIWPRTDDYGTTNYNPVISHVKINNVALQPNDTVCKNALGDAIWVNDILPNGAVPAATNDSWNWIVAPAHPPFAGRFSQQSSLASGFHQVYFSGAGSKLTVNSEDVLIAYILIDPENPPSQVMLQWLDTGGSWEHRAYWGSVSTLSSGIQLGSEGTQSRYHKGPLPRTGEWVRLEVPAQEVGLDGKTLHGMAFTLFGGRATWDYAGKYTPGTQTAGCPPKTGRSQLETFHAYNPDEYATGAANSKVVEVKYADGTSRWFMAFNSMIKHVGVTYTDSVSGLKVNNSNYGKSWADNWRILWATSSDGVNWAVHPNILFRSVEERIYEWSGLLLTDMLVDNGYFYILFQDLIKPHLYLARARINPSSAANVPGYVQNSTEGWSIASYPITPNGQYSWKRIENLGAQLNFDNLEGSGVKAYPIMPSVIFPPPVVKQGSISRIFKSSTPFSESRIFGITNDSKDSTEVVQLWSAPDITMPLVYESNVILDPSIIKGGNGWEFGFSHYADNVPATPRVFGTDFDLWVTEKPSPGSDVHVLLTRRRARLSNF